MRPYLDLVQRVLDEGERRPDRTRVGTRSLFGHQMRFDLADGFPLLTNRKIHLKSIVYELLWFIRGETNIGYLKEHGVSIWDEWADDAGELGPVYGKQWRRWQTADGRVVDQLEQVIDQIKRDPTSRRLIVSAWNVADIPRMALAPCHVMFQFYVSGSGHLSCQLYQRSADLFLGVPFNIASYALLTRMVADQVGLAPGDFIWVGGDCHVYSNHVDQVREQLSREVLPFPALDLAPAPSLFDYTYEHFTLRDYRHHPAIRAAVAV